MDELINHTAINHTGPPAATPDPRRRRRWVGLAMTFCLVATSGLFALAGPASATVDQVSGYADWGLECDGTDYDGVIDYVIPVAGDLEGCIYGAVTDATTLPSGVYHETANETFVGSFHGRYGTFDMIEDYIAKEGTTWGRCHHPIVRGSGTGDFEGVSGRLDFQDDLTAVISTTYKGHLKFR